MSHRRILDRKVLHSKVLVVLLDSLAKLSIYLPLLVKGEILLAVLSFVSLLVVLSAYFLDEALCIVLLAG